MFERETHRDDEPVEDISEEKVRQICNFFQLKPPSKEAIVKYLQAEEKSIAIFYEQNPDFFEDIEIETNLMLSQYGVMPNDRSPIEITSRMRCVIENIDDVLFVQQILSPGVKGIYNPETDRTYILASQRFEIKSSASLALDYLHEAVHGAGYKDDKTGKRGFGGVLLDEGIAENLAIRYASAFTSDSEEMSAAICERVKKSYYLTNINIFRALAREVSEKALYQAFFKGEKSGLIKLLEESYGPGAFGFFTRSATTIMTADLILSCAKNPLECKRFLEIRNGNDTISVTNDLNKELLNRFLYSHFLDIIGSDFRSFREKRETSKESLLEKYPQEIVDIFIENKKLDFSYIYKFAQVIFYKYINSKIEELYQ